MTTRTIVRLPLSPLYEQVRLAARPRLRDVECITDIDQLVADAVRVSRRTVLRWRSQGGIPLWNADKAAAALNLHPANPWPEWAE